MHMLATDRIRYAVELSTVNVAVTEKTGAISAGVLLKKVDSSIGNPSMPDNPAIFKLPSPPGAAEPFWLGIQNSTATLVPWCTRQQC